MTKWIALLLLCAPAFAQTPSPALPLSGSVAAGGNFPLLLPGSVVFASDANHTMVYPETVAYTFTVTSSVALTTQRNIIGPLLQGTYTVKNATTGGQSIQLIGATGTGTVIPNGLTKTIYCDGANYTVSAVSYADIPDRPFALPPNGTAGGDLSGSYPGPVVKAFNGANIPFGTKILGTDVNGKPVAASSSDVQNVIGSGVYDASGAAAARAAAGSCAANQYAIQTTAAGVVCAQVQASQVGGLANIATSGSASDLNSGTIAASRLPFTVPSGTVVGTTDTQGLSNKAITASTINGTPIGGTAAANGHFSHLQADDLAGTQSTMLATADTAGNIGPSGVQAPASSIPPPNTFGFMTITGNAVNMKGTLTSGSNVATGVTFTDSHSWANLSNGQAISDGGLLPGGTTISTFNSTAGTITFNNNATGTSTSTALVAALPGATVSYTTGIGAACPGATPSCALQQLNPAPTNGGTTLTQNYDGSGMMHVNTLANLSPSGIGIMSQDGGGAATFVTWSGIDSSNAGDPKLTGVTLGYWGTNNYFTGTGGTTGKAIYQVNIAYSLSSTSIPYFIVLQTGSIMYDAISGTGGSMNTQLFNQISSGVTYWNGFTSFAPNLFGLNTGGYQSWRSQGLIHDENIHSAWVNQNCIANLDSYWGYVHVGASNGVDAATSQCAAATNGIDPSEWFIYVSSTSQNFISATTPLSALPGPAQWRVGHAKATLSVPLYQPEIIGNSTAPICAAGAAAGTGATCTITGTDTDFTVTLTPAGTPTASGTLFTVTFGATLTTANPRVNFSANNVTAAAQATNVANGTKNATTYTMVNGSAALVAGTAYSWDFHVLE